MGAQPRSGASRRTVLAAAGAAGATAALTGCAVYGDEPVAAPPPAPPRAPAGSDAPPLATVSDIPVGSGKIFTDEKVVVTQPEEGTIKAFSVTCTHQGCPVTKIAEGTIDCECHGSKFKVADGSVAKGPANKPLDPVKVKVDGEEIRLA